jgi:hypothetical protein
MNADTHLAPSRPLNRQEIFAYGLIAAVVLFVALTAVLLFHMLSPLATVSPRVNLGQASDFPIANAPYLVGLELNARDIEAYADLDVRFFPSIWLVHTEAGWFAFNRYTPPIGKSSKSCIYAWTPTNGRFEDPCYGSKFTLYGHLIEPPASRNLLSYPVTIRDGEVWLDLSQPLPGAIVEPLCRLDDTCL